MQEVDIHIRCIAVKCPAGTYFGTLEVVQAIAAVERLGGEWVLVRRIEAFS